MFKGFDNITLNDFFKLSSTTLRGHTLKIYKPNSNPVWAYPGSGQIAVIWMLRNFFTVRNSIPILLINCETIATFNKTSRLFTKESGIYISFLASFLLLNHSFLLGWLVEFSLGEKCYQNHLWGKRICGINEFVVYTFSEGRG